MLLEDRPLRQRLALPGVTALISFLAFTSQSLFANIEPEPLRRGEAYIFNLLVTCLLICYGRTCLTDPGRIPKDWHERFQNHLSTSTTITSSSSSWEVAAKAMVRSNRWCRRCEAFKPPRAHHCKTCQRCIMKMDHHCVWTANCVSHITIPHFIRFLFYAVLSMSFLEYFLFIRVALLWEKRKWPSHLGPSMFQLAHLFILCIVNSFVLFALSLLLGRTLWSIVVNTWTIEGWEIERHHVVLRRARVFGGFLEAPDGSKVRIEHQEFPWDVGLWSNICQGMGSRNPVSWFWPFASSPSVHSGLSFAHNTIDDPSKPWPPPDPDRLFRAERKPLIGDGFTQSWDIEGFRKRQAADVARYADAHDGDYIVRRRPFHERYGKQTGKTRDYYPGDAAHATLIETDDESEEGEEVRHGQGPRQDDEGGEEAWRNGEGDRLADFGVDEVADFYDEDDVPLAELIRRLNTAEVKMDRLQN